MSVTSDELNYLIWRYLQESGHELTTFALQRETRAHLLDSQFSKHISIGALVSIVQKGIQYMEVEASLRDNGEPNTEEKPFTLFGALHADDQEPKGAEISNHNTTTTLSIDTKVNGSSRPDSSRNGSSSSNLPDDKNRRLALEAPRNTDESKQNSAAEIADEDRMDIDEPTTTSSTKTASYQGTINLPTLPKSQDNKLKPSSSQDAKIQVQTIKLPNPIRDLFSIYGTGPSEAAEWSPTSPTTLVIAQSDLSATLYTFPNFYSDSNPDTSSSIEPTQSLKLIHSAIDYAEEKDVTAVAWNSTGTLCATATFDGQMRIWTSSGKLRHNLLLHRAPVLVIRWNEPNTLLLSVDCTNTVVVWDAYNGEVRQTFQHSSTPSPSTYPSSTHSIYPPSSSSALAPAPGYSLPNGTDTPSQQPAQSQPQQTANTVSIGTDADWIDPLTYATTGENASIVVYKISERGALLRFRGHTQGINSLQFDMKSQYLASGSDDHTIKIWHGKSPTAVMTLLGHLSSVIQVRWLSPTGIISALDPNAFGGARLASASLDGTIRIWDPSKGVCLSVLSLHESPIFACEVSPNGRLIASGGLDGVLIVWDVSNITDIEQSAVLAMQEPNKKLCDISGATHAIARYELSAPKKVNNSSDAPPPSEQSQTPKNTHKPSLSPSNSSTDLLAIAGTKPDSLKDADATATFNAQEVNKIKKESDLVKYQDKEAQDPIQDHINSISWSCDSAKICVCYGGRSVIVDASPLLPNVTN